MLHRTALICAFLLAAAASWGADTQKLTLRQAEQIALQEHPRIASARFTAQAAGEVPRELRSNYLPQVTGSLTGAGAADASRIAAGGLNNPVIYNRLASGFTVSQMITDFGRTGNLIASAKLDAQAQNQNTEVARARTVLQVDRAYYALLKAQSVLRVAQQTVKARQLVTDQVTALAQSKLKSSLDVSFANVNLSEAKLMLASAENDLNSASAEFSAALGYPDQRTFDLADEPAPGALADSVDQLVEKAARNRPELAEARFREDSAQRLVKAQRALYFPTISTIAAAGYLPDHASTLSNRYAAAGLNINIPVLNGGLFSARRQEAELRAQAAGKDLQGIEEQVARDVRVAYQGAMTAYQRIGLTAQMLDQARLALDLAQSRYDIGLGSIVELSQAQLNATSAELAGASARYDYQSERALLAYETGTNR
jgi:outer membrane protein